jgi:hypothetical protein
MGTFAHAANVDYLYRLLTKENKLCRFRFPIAAKNGSCLFPLV